MLAAALTKQDRAFLDALKELQVVREFVGSPERILGSAHTKHGEIAEQVHVGVRRAFDVLHQRTPSASFEGVDRFGRVDYLDRGREIQSKFYNGLQNTLEGIRSHAEQHKDFTSSGGGYQAPKDQFEQLEQLLDSGAIDGLSNRSVERLQRAVENLERTTGRPLEDLVESSEVRYDEIQQARVHETIKDREHRLTDKNEELKDQARGEHGPSMSGAVTAAAVGAAAGGSVCFAQAVWVKYREGKNPFQGEFCVEDWKDVGLDTAKGAGTGAVAGGTLYLLTNSTDLAAPFAGALVSSLMGIGDLLGQYHAGEIDVDQFVDCSLMVAAEAAIVSLSAAAGQTLVPIPMLGAFVGSIAGKIVASAVRDGLGEAESELVERLKAYEAEAIGKLDDALRAVIEELDAHFGRLSDLVRIAFDETVNTQLRLAASIQIAEAVQVPDNQILRSKADLDTFMEE
ncbi:MAG: hypothetical protein OXQ84_02165 [bacterium]|nr:hypothetical protein [bacterium]